ncbi:MAG TPA: hypothetical protein VHI52_09840 [Verrucomicrobiae bacterium]|nr:hypothetical protein [Verrucomicrobiae bacterium]
MQKHLALLLLARVGTVLRTAADDASPSAVDARELLAHRIARQSQAWIRLLDFKTDSGPSPAPWDTDGERRFLVTFRAVIEFTQPCVWAAAPEGDSAGFTTLKPGLRAAVPNRVFIISSVGARFAIRGQLAMKGNGNGWELTGFSWSDPPQKLSSPLGTRGPMPTISPAFPFPADSVQNEFLRAQFYLPDGKRGYYRGTRFDWSGLLFRVQAEKHSFFTEFRKTHDPFTHDDICGTAEEFGINNPAGYTRAGPGGSFLKIGIGLLERPDEGAYNFAKRYRLVQEGTWQVSRKPNEVEFRQDFTGSDGWGYSYKKTLELEPGAPVLKIIRSLKNTGTQSIETDHYGHNFLKIDEQPAGPGYEIEFPFVPKLGAGSQTQNCIEVRDRALVFVKEVPPEDSVWLRIEGFSNLPDNRLTVRNRQTGGWVRITTDQPASRMAFFSHAGVLSPEPFVEVNVPPGATKIWTTTYTFGGAEKR